MAEPYTLVTGATSGIGAAIAERLAASMPLILAGRDAQKLEAQRSRCPNPGAHLTWVMDLADSAGVEASLSAFMASAGCTVSHVVYCAGRFDMRPIHTVSMADTLGLFNVNLFSAIEIVRLLSRKRVNKGALKSVTFISSIASRLGTKGYHVYAASKGALNSLARSLAVELAPQVRVNCVLPGGIETPSTRQFYEDPKLREEIAASAPLGLGRVSDIADAVEFLTSEKARWITGQEMVVDGGRSIL